jgi:hypothetical protein
MWILEALKAMCPKEVIDGSDVDETAKMVDLDVEFTPVLPDPVIDPETDYSGHVPTPFRVQLDGSRYCVWTPNSPETYRWVDEESLKVMRARYLLLRGFYHRTIEGMPYGYRQEVISKFFPDGLFKPAILTELDSGGLI